MRILHNITMTVATTTLVIAAPCFADGDHLDGWFGLDGDTGNITFLGGATIGGGGEIDQTFPGPPVYERIFGDDGLPANETEIGFAAFDGAFANFQGFHINFVDALLFWDGNGDVSFGSTDSTVTINFGPQSATSTDGPFDEAIAFAADDEGGFHGDQDVVLSDGASTGVYLMQLSLSFDDTVRGLIGESETSYWVMGFGVDDETVELAVDAIPAPGALALFGLAMMRTRSRRRNRTNA